MSANQPSPPSPQVTAAEQLNLNKKTSAYEAQQNRFAQNNPFGQISWKNTGTADKPNWTQTTTLSKGQQGIYNNQLGTQQKLAAAARNLAPSVSGMLGNQGYASTMGGDLATRNHVEQALMDRLNPSLRQDEDALRARLANQGLQYGTEAYGNAMRDQSQRVNDARLAVVGQAGQEMQLAQGLDTTKQQNSAAARNQRLAELSALMQGSGNINMPTYGGTQQVSTGQAPDIGSLVNSNYQGKVAGANAQTASGNAALGALAQLGSSAIGKKW